MSNFVHATDWAAAHGWEAMACSEEDDASAARREVEELEKQIADLKARWPIHSVPPSMLEQLEELEERLEKAKRRAGDGEAD